MFEDFTFENIMDNMLTNVDDELDKRQGSIIYDALAPCALELSNFYEGLDLILDEVFADSATYHYLIKRAAERGIYPQEASKATLKMIVSPVDAPIHIGDRFNKDELNYSVSSIIDAENGEYAVECDTEGIVGNQQLGELITVSSTNDLTDLVSATLDSVLIPGEDEEEEEAFRNRYFNSFSTEAFGGNKADYIDNVNAIDGVGGCKVKRSWVGVGGINNIQPSATVTTWVNNQTSSSLGTSVYSWIRNIHDLIINHQLAPGGTVEVVIIDSDFNSPSSALVNSVQELLDPDAEAEGEGIAPIGHQVIVFGVATTTVDVSIEAYYSSGYTFNAIKSDIEDAIDEYLLDLRREWSNSNFLLIDIDDVESVVAGVTGVSRVNSIQLNNSTYSMQLMDSIPVRGVVSG